MLGAEQSIQDQGETHQTTLWMWWDRRAIDHRPVHIPAAPKCIRKRNDRCNDPQESVAVVRDSQAKDHPWLMKLSGVVLIIPNL